MKIATRLQLQTAVAIAAFSVILVIAFVQLNRIRDASAYIAEKTVPSIELLGTASLNFVQQRAALFSMMGQTPDKQGAVMQSFQRYRKELYDSLQRYEALVRDEEERQLLNAFRQGADVSNQHFDEIIRTFLGGDAGAAMSRLNNLRDEFLQVRDQALKLIQHNQQEGRDAHQQLKDAERSALLWLAVTAVLALLTLGLIAWRTYLQVVGSINTAAADIADMTEHLDLSRRCSIRRDDEIGGLLQHFNQLTTRLHDSLQRVADSSAQVSTTAASLAAAAGQVSAGSSAQSQSASSMAAALEQITVSINHVADRTQEANTLAQDTGHKARHGEQVIENSSSTILGMADSVRDVSSHMGALNQQTNAIHSVINVIRDVADQTNLLALNAAIEAARAGEMGRGFAVVADEVRKLAERTTQSTLEISDTVQRIQTESREAVESMNSGVLQVEAGVKSASEAGASLQSIRDGARKVEESVVGIAEALREQSTASMDIAHNVERVAQQADQNHHKAHDASLAACEMTAMAQQLRQSVSRFKI